MKKVRNFLQKIFHPKSGTYSFFLGLMSFSAILISLLTLQEMKTQRELSMMPIVRIQNPNSIEIQLDSACTQSYYTQDIRLLEEDEISPKKIEDWFALHLVNVGEGSAVNLEIEWQIDYKWFEDQFTKLKLDPLLFNLQTKEDFILLTYKNCYEGNSGDYYEKAGTEKKSHLLSTSKDVKPLKIRIPPILLKLYISAIRSDWIKNGQNKENLLSEESLESSLTIRYESVTGYAYSERYELNVTLIPPHINATSLEGNLAGISASYNDFILDLAIKEI